MAETSHLIELAKGIQAQAAEPHQGLAQSASPIHHSFWMRGLRIPLRRTPIELLHGVSATDFVSRHALDRFEVHQKIPVGETRTYTELAEATNLPLTTIRRLVRHAMTQRVFTEPSPGVVAHSPASKLIAENVNVRDYWGIIAQIVFTAAPQTTNALSRWPKESGEKNREKSGFFLVNGKTVHQMLEDEPETHKRYDSAMSANRDNMMYSVEHVANGFDWASLGHSTVVDVAGGIGTVSRELAKYFPNLKFIVQDQPEVLSTAPDIEDESINSRITFMEHDMFTPQPIADADVYFFRRVFMEWTDDKAVEILRNYAWDESRQIASRHC